MNSYVHELVYKNLNLNSHINYEFIWFFNLWISMFHELNIWILVYQGSIVGVGSNHSNVNPVSTQYQQVSTLMKLVVSSKSPSQKVTFSCDSAGKMAFWLSLAQI